MKSTLKKILPIKLSNYIKKQYKKISTQLFLKNAPSISKNDIFLALKNLDIKKGDTLMVHSSLKGLGKIENGPKDIINAILELIGDNGNVLMPAFTISGSMYETLSNKELLFDPTNTENISTGVISKVFSKDFATKRSIHPTHSISCMGPLANYFCEYHAETGNNFGEGTPFGKALEVNAKILGIGVDFKPITFYHVLEDLYPNYFTNCYLADEIQIKAKNHFGESIDLSIKCHNPIFHETRIEKNEFVHEYFKNAFFNKGIAKSITVGLGQIWVMSSKDLINFLLEEYHTGKTIYKVK
jgi:aminoglycoside 3-N-acetyltransferase